MLCLDGMEEGTGAVEIIRNSHRITDAEAENSSLRGRTWSPKEIERIECAPGSVVILHAKTVHGSGPNATGRVRRNIIMQWGSATNPLTTEARELHTGWRPQSEESDASRYSRYSP
jgi:ectoine hydroxylase-related dioxygenase (phytanoyl-CoA dioxygenase family)